MKSVSSKSYYECCNDEHFFFFEHLINYELYYRTQWFCAFFFLFRYFLFSPLHRVNFQFQVWQNQHTTLHVRMGKWKSINKPMKKDEEGGKKEQMAKWRWRQWWWSEDGQKLCVPKLWVLRRPNANHNFNVKKWILISKLRKRTVKRKHCYLDSLVYICHQNVEFCVLLLMSSTMYVFMLLLH